MIESSPVVEGLLMIHKIITRGIAVSIKKCDEYIGKENIPGEEVQGFVKFVSTLKWITHAHHLTEDEMGYPYFKNHIEAPYDRLTEDHKTITRLLSKMDPTPLIKASDGIGELRKAIGEFDTLWHPHIKIEEEKFTPEKVNSFLSMKQQANLAVMFGKHSSKNSGPGSLALPFMFYNLEPADRKSFMMSFPWIVKKVLVPVVWKGEWRPMSSFLLSAD